MNDTCLLHRDQPLCDRGVCHQCKPQCVHPTVLSEELLLNACLDYAVARWKQLVHRENHGGGDDVTLVDATREAYNRLLAASPIGRELDDARNKITVDVLRVKRELAAENTEMRALLDQAEILLRDVARARLGIGDDYAAWRSKLAEWLHRYDETIKV